MIAKKTILLAGIASISIPLSAAQAQEVSEPSIEQSGLSVIVVTAQKRDEDLQDVPVSVVAISGEAIADAGIENLGNLSDYVPNLSIVQDPIGDKINIRGIQSGNNAGLEQSVATFVDGVYRGRGVQARFNFLDVERVEVLRGPQGTLFGKNTIGGAINIATARPTDYFSTAFSATYNFDNIQQYIVGGHVSGPISENVSVRLAATYDNIDEGWVDDLYYGSTAPRMEQWAGRFSLDAALGDGTSLFARVEYGDFDLAAQPFTQITPGPLAAFGVPASLSQSLIGSSEPVLDFGSPGTMRGDNFEAALILNQEIGDNLLTVTGAYSAYDFLRQCDCDFSPLDMVRFDDSEDFEQTSIEIRLASPGGDRFDWLAGAYYQASDLYADGLAQFNLRGGPGEVAVDTLLNAGCQGAIAAGADPATNRACILSGLVSAFDGTPLAYRDFGRFHVLDQSGEAFALFGQGTFNFAPSWSLTAGLRYTHEEKNAAQSAYPTSYGTVVRDDATYYDNYQGPYAPFAPFRTLAEGVPHTFDLARSEDSLTWSANLAYEPAPEVLLYAKIATGFKAGGFNSFALSDDPGEAEFEPEEVIGGEIGGKFTIFDGAGEINVAAFYSEFKDIQTALFTGSTSFIVQNASSARSYGLELDSRFALGEHVELRAALAYVDFAFDSFPNAGCTVDQLIAFRITTANPLATVQDCAAAEINDLAGETSDHTPEFSGSLGLRHEWPLGDFTLTNDLAANFATAQFRQADLDPVLRQDGFIKVNWVATFAPSDGPWDVSFFANNLFDEQTFSYGNDTPLIDTARQAMPDRPRTFGVRVRLRH